MSDIIYGMVIKTSTEFNFPYATLNDHINGKHVKPNGRPIVLKEEEKETIVSALEYSSRYGWPCTRADLRKIVAEFFVMQKRDVPWRYDASGKDFLQ
jgi:hypothetical protein